MSLTLSSTLAPAPAAGASAQAARAAADGGQGAGSFGEAMARSLAPEPEPDKPVAKPAVLTSARRPPAAAREEPQEAPGPMALPFMPLEARLPAPPADGSAPTAADEALRSSLQGLTAARGAPPPAAPGTAGEGGAPPGGLDAPGGLQDRSPLNSGQGLQALQDLQAAKDTEPAQDLLASLLAAAGQKKTAPAAAQAGDASPADGAPPQAEGHLPAPATAGAVARSHPAGSQEGDGAQDRPGGAPHMAAPTPSPGDSQAGRPADEADKADALGAGLASVPPAGDAGAGTSATLLANMVNGAGAPAGPPPPGGPVQAGAPAPMPALAPEVGSGEWGKALGQHVVHMGTAGQPVAELQLNPPGLGPLKVTLSMNEQQMQATFVSAHAAVRAAVEAALPQLRTALADSGISLGNTSVGAESQPQTTSGNNQNDSPGHPAHRRLEVGALFGQPAAQPAALAVPVRQGGRINTYA